MNDKICPNCSARPGTLQSLSVGNGSVLLSLSCPACGHGWQVERGRPAPNWNEEFKTARSA